MKTRSKTILISAVSIAILAIFTYISEADFDRRLNYQGRLTDSNGVPVADAVGASMTFVICTNGSSTALCSGSSVWTETVTVNISDGLFSATLGSVTSLNTLDFTSTEYYVQVT